MVIAADRMPVLFLWHHHQPFYLGPRMVHPIMPWVRLHAACGYHDMAQVVEATGAAVTFNFSPCLIEQLSWAVAHDPCDEFERISRIRPQDMNEQERRFVLQHFFSINWATYVLPVARYRELLARRGERPDEAQLRRAALEFTVQDFLDLITLFNLSWIGFAGRKDSGIARLLEKGRGYEASDIDYVLRIHRSILASILPLYRRLLEAQGIEISVSPYSHAILPLLCDSGIAAPDISRQALPRSEYHRPEDADRQLQMAVETHRNTWGVSPEGLWPSEGSVSDEVLDLAAHHGFSWISTDQGVLSRSETTRKDGLSHFFPYLRKREPATIRVYFRDHALSDAIGFRYSSLKAEAAVAEFIGHLQRIEESTREMPGRCVVIALDGENPWESFADRGERFLQTLYSQLAVHPKLGLSTFSAHAQPGFRETIHRLHAGSWIDANFRIWIGDPEKNQAWTELERARRVLDELPVGDERRSEALHWLLRAQCSDWMWWYGDPFSSEYKPHFDELFRSFLKAVYESAGRMPPPSLETAISIPRKIERRVQPMFPVSPKIDGVETSFFEWTGSCRIETRQYGTTMGRSEHVIRSLWYGFGGDHVYFRCDPAPRLHSHKELILNLHIFGDALLVVAVPLSTSAGLPSQADQATTPVGADGVFWAVREIVEIAAPRERLGLQSGGECQFWAEVVEDEAIIEKLPPQGAYRFVVPSDESLAANWLV